MSPGRNQMRLNNEQKLAHRWTFAKVNFSFDRGFVGATMCNCLMLIANVITCVTI